jgi:uncharacterized protein (DUF433 family)
MPPTPSKKRQADLRAVPSYGIAESAHYLGICESTLRSWLYGRPYPTRSGTVKRTTAIIHPADPRNGILSFYNLVEAHVLLFHRQVYGIRLPAVRAAVEHVRKTLGLKRPLIHQVFYTDGKDLFINELEKEVIIDASKRGQLGIWQILNLYVQRIEWDKEGFARKLLPVRASQMNGPRIVIDPKISFGRPVLVGTGITASVLWHRKRLGENIDDISKDYGLDRSAVEEAISYYKAA